jgi:NAD(P)-dependent dehydrogenase (short-subunit alcohol dehydrogenase family)
MNDLKDKVILITGAGKGAGRALAEAFAQRGAIIAAIDISPVNVEEVVEQINADGGKARVYIDDIAKKVAAQALIKNVEDDFGQIDILINHAAVEPHTPLLKMDEWDWHRTLDVNLTGAFLMIQSIGRVMREHGHGVIINIVPGADQEVEREAGAYFASMAGLEELSLQADHELSPFGVRVYAIQNRDHEKTVQDVMSVLNQEE